MSVDKFDKELSDLYQQSKQQTDAPRVDLTGATKPTNSLRSPWHMLVLLVAGGAASFGIMALVTNFVKPPEHGDVHGTVEQYKQHSVRIVEITEVKLEELVLPPPTAPLPPKPESNAPKATSEVATPTTAIAKPTLALDKPMADLVNVPTIKQPIFDIKPIHKVMPEYPKSALYSRKSGTVKLQYRISYTGKVIDISGLNKHGDRLLERSAKQALSQWRYPEESGGEKFLEIEFEFNLAQ
jgi:TonB family protein